MSEDTAVHALETLVEVVRLGQEHQRDVLELVRSYRVQVEEHGDSLVALSNRIDANYRAVRPLLFSKTSMTTMTCGCCGNEYATEEGPELCGPCWVRLGRPETWTPPRASRA